MPAAIAPCHGSMRLVSVTTFNRKDEADCPYCNLSPKCERVEVPYDKRYYKVPNHRPQGRREPKQIDWSNPQ
jgi:hypothetical protein